MWKPIEERIVGHCPSTTATAIDSQIVPPGEIWELTFAAVYNGSAESFKVALAIVDHSQEIPFNVTAALATLTAVATNIVPILLEGQKLRATGTGSTSGGNLTLIFTGKRRTLAQGQVD